MKGILIASVLAAFAITVIDSLSCEHCESFNSSCVSEIVTCGEEFISCVQSSVNSTLGGSKNSYESKFCSKDKCTTVNNNTEVSFIVHVSDNQEFSFSSQCCEGDACPGNKKEGEEGEGNSGNTRADTQIQCPSCYSSNTTTVCNEEIRQCSQGEQCVHIIADHVNGNKVELKGCSNIDEATCDILTPGNVTVGEFTFQTVSCTNEITTTTPTTVTTTPSTSTTIKASFISSVFGSLLLLKLLF